MPTTGGGFVTMAKQERRKVRAPDVCPVCGEDVPPKALACAGCGADHKSGWKASLYDELDLPNDDFDYDEFVQQEFGSSIKPTAIKLRWWITAIVLIILFAATYLYAVR
jgi:hypothetical protein